eukprot:jgi/Tetstr1/440054/TSEL_028413.t1
MAAVNRRSRVLEGECLVECFEEAYASEPQRYKNTACTACFGPLPAPVAVVERATWVNDIVNKCREPSLEAWDREYSSVKYCERGDSEKPGVGRLVRGYVFLTMRAMELMFGLHNVRQGGKDVGYGNIRRRKNSLKLAAPPPPPPATLVETVERQPNGAVTTELVATFSTAKASVTSDPPSSCRPKMSSAHPVDTSPVAVPDDEDPIQQAKVTKYPRIPPWACDQREYVQYKFQQSVLEEDYLGKRNERIRMLVAPEKLLGQFTKPGKRRRR